MRFNIGFYQQHKVMQSDEDERLPLPVPDELHALPGSRPRAVRAVDAGGRRVVDMAVYGKVLRLGNTRSSSAGCTTTPIRKEPAGQKAEYMYLAESPKAVVKFLESNAKLPTRYKAGSRDLLERLAQFPVLPPASDRVLTAEKKPNEELTDAEADGVLVARGWYAYSLAVVPPPTDVPGPTPTLTADQQKLYRIPKRPMLIIFRQSTPQAQSFYAERVQKEGWFGGEAWKPDEDDADAAGWFPSGTGFESPVNCAEGVDRGVRPVGRPRGQERPAARAGADQAVRGDGDGVRQLAGDERVRRRDRPADHGRGAVRPGDAGVVGGVPGAAVLPAERPRNALPVVLGDGQGGDGPERGGGPAAAGQGRQGPAAGQAGGGRPGVRAGVRACGSRTC